MYRLTKTLVLLAVPVLAAVMAPTAAGAATPIGPNQIFLGQVNGNSRNAVVTVLCPGPVATGHPVNDTVGVIRLVDPIPGFGRTGNAHQINADVFWAAGPIVHVEHIASFITYTTQAFPSTLTLPCSGTGSVTFTPVNGGSGATPTTVPVTFLNLGA